jgi:hypothetical protein
MNAVTFNRRMSERTARMQTTPAGVTIGIATIPRMRIDMTADALRLQAALLAKPKTADALVGWVLAGCGLAVAVMAVFGWLPGPGL